VQVRIHAASLNFRDYLVAKGLYNPKMPLPRVPLSDGAGEVTAVGEGVTRVKPGDRVAAAFHQGWIGGEYEEAYGKTSLGGAIDGVLADYVVFGEEGLVALPPHLSYIEAAALPCAAVTAWNALISQGHIKAGDSVLLQGTGGVSIFALQFAKLSGARVIITSSSDEKLARARALGAEEGINYKKNPDWEKTVLPLTGGAGVDHIVEVGGAGTLARSLKVARAQGRVSVIGVLSGIAGELSIAPILHKHLTVQGIYVGSRTMFEDMNRAIELHRLHPVIDRVYPMEQIQEALRYMESGAHIGKIAIDLAA
jgi:NADPH:quinone reductase-like Zn-dependent oxidoreductase